MNEPKIAHAATAGQEFYPNREEAEAIVTEVEGALRKAGVE